MSDSAEVITFTKTVAIADVDGRPIREGSVLKHVKEPVVGVVNHIVRPSDRRAPMFSAVGDLHIRHTSYCTRVTNRYTDWKHVPTEEQTYRQRYLSWLLTKADPEDHDAESSRMTEDQARAVAGIMALLPDDAVDWTYGPTPDTVKDALDILSRHLAKLSKQEE